mmetsp:Transcript_5051/g.12763  ORF Transcript_5051/g.12763 Transcript_5051/m.12763 type:complete len:291 (-) Transcript_5051:777-1649(-)
MFFTAENAACMRQFSSSSDARPGRPGAGPSYCNCSFSCRFCAVFPLSDKSDAGWSPSVERPGSKMVAPAAPLAGTTPTIVRGLLIAPPPAAPDDELPRISTVFLDTRRSWLAFPPIPPRGLSSPVLWICRSWCKSSSKRSQRSAFSRRLCFSDAIISSLASTSSASRFVPATSRGDASSEWSFDNFVMPPLPFVLIPMIPGTGEFELLASRRGENRLMKLLDSSASSTGAAWLKSTKPESCPCTYPSQEADCCAPAGASRPPSTTSDAASAAIKEAPAEDEGAPPARDAK